jgi:beta-galactosidase
MREAGVNLVSLAIFSWSRIQPDEKTWNFDWLDRVIDLLHEGGVRVNLATATASPPPWLSHAHPEMLPMLADGTRLWHGARQHYCPSSPIYRSAAQRLVEAMANRYAKHPALAMWHIGNEFGCHVSACYCEVSAEAFRQWLARRYATIEDLNRAWGTDFWSQRYSSWEEIIPPRRTPTWPNPSQQLDFMRFSSDALLECHELERDLLTQLSPEVPVTTNFMSFFKPLDYWKWAEREDVVSNDSYPDPSDPASPVKAAMAGDLMRSLGRGRPWILMEQTTDRVNWREINVSKPPGLMRLWSYQALARGADGIMFFQWRQSRAGAEKFHSAMVPHGPIETSPVWRDMKTMGAELARLDAVGDTRTRAEVAILFDWDSWWALELPSKPSTAVRQIDQVEALYRPLYEANVTVDFARPQDDLSNYRLVIAPSLYLVTDEAAANVERFVRGGGVLVMTFFSGIVDEFEHIRLGGYPKPFADLLGVSVVDFYPLGAGDEVGLRFADGTVGRGSVWSEEIEPRGAETIATFADGVVGGRPAITSNAFGKGTAIYVGTRPDPAALSRVLISACETAGAADGASTPRSVEVVRRAGKGKSILFLLNHRDVAVDVPVAEAGRNLVDGAEVHRGLIRLQPRGVAVIEEGW